VPRIQVQPIPRQRRPATTVTYSGGDRRATSWSDDCSLYGGGQEQMLRIVLGVSALGALLVTYWVHPPTAWIVLGSTFTLAIAFKVRQRDEAEGALQTIDE
jgi:hypothetical protein